MSTQFAVRSTGWRTFAGVLFVVVGAFNFIDGIVAIANAHYLSDHLVFGDLRSWGWTMLILGIIVFLVGLAILAGQAWAGWVGIVLAALNAIGQLLFLPAYPFWSVITIALDVVVIYGLAVYATTPAEPS
ncbi:MAG TPA: hypothetical protein VHB02_03170 [Acidimicrobiales bacterium]|nr:hypothetical protein [Acidimicrobiales bacterium]